MPEPFPPYWLYVNGNGFSTLYVGRHSVHWYKRMVFAACPVEPQPVSFHTEHVAQTRLTSDLWHRHA